MGGGIIGLSSAYQLMQRGCDVTIVDPEPGRGAAWVAAGMLTPGSEAHFGEEHAVRLFQTGLDTWEDFARELGGPEPNSVGFERCGTLEVAVDASDRVQLEQSVLLQRSLDIDIIEKHIDEAEAIEPALSPHIRGLFSVAQDARVDPRRVLQCLLDALRQGGARFVASEAVSVALSGGGVAVTLDNGTKLESSTVVCTLGSWTNRVAGLERGPKVRPVKGHVLRLFGPPLLTHTIRATTRGRSVYLVQRPEGELVVGATVEEMGFDTTLQAGQIRQLLNDAQSVVSGIEELELREVSAGLRPALEGLRPIVDWLEPEKILIATGHYRNGVLLAPLTSLAVTGMVLGDPYPSASLFGSIND